MRDHPAVPNVFRVASSHSINSLGITATPRSNNKQRVQGNINYTKSNSYEQQQQQPPQTEPQQEQQLQQQQQQRQQLARHQLTTSASIERTHHQSVQQEQSPYATLPRGSSNSNSSNCNGGQRRAAQQQQQTGVINTISGSILSTGFTSLADSLHDLQLNNGNGNSNANNNDKRQQHLQQQQQQQQRQLLSLGIYKAAERQPQRTTTTAATAATNIATTGNGAAILTAQSGFNNMTNANGGYLWLLTPVAASISVAIVIAALAGPQWLFTEEKLPNVNYNGTANFNALDDGAYVTKYTKSSLWILCTTLPGLDVDTFNCVKIDYFPEEGYQPDPQDSTPAIPYTVTKSCPIFLASGIFLLISFIVFLIPTCSHQNNLYYFSAGILFIVSGLVMLIGLIAYISILKAEIGSKLRPRSTLQPPLIKVTYGQSFFLFVFGFIATEFVGVLNIFLYINLQELSYYSRLPCFSVVNMQTKIKEGQQEHALLSHSYKRYKETQSTPEAASPVALVHGQQQNNQQQQQHVQQQQQMRQQMPLRASNGRLHQVHDAGRGPIQTQTLPAGGYACRKHPNVNVNGSNTNLYAHNDLERRYYFEKPVASNCNLHSRSFAKSLNQLCMEPGTLSAAAPADRLIPPAATFADLPQEFPLTRSVSTTTDIYATAASSPTAQLQRKQRRNMATNTQMEGGKAPRESARLCGLKRGLRKTKDELFQEFCKRAGIRNKPKNIYYIPSEDAGDEDAPRTPHRSHNDDDDADGDDHGFREFRSGPALDDEQLFVVADHPQLVHPQRMPIYMEAMMPQPAQQLRRLNSNLSLHTQASNIWPWPDQQRLASEHGQSRTLPRSFMRQPVGSQDSLASHLSSYSPSHQRLTQLMQYHQQQQQPPYPPQNRYMSTLTLPLHNEENLNAPAVQWPTAIPSSPSNYVNGYPHPQPLYTPAIAVPVSSSSTATSHPHPAKFQRAYAFDDVQHRRGSSVLGDAFDLDELERERRRSHASLFVGLNVPPKREHYDLINGTAV